MPNETSTPAAANTAAPTEAVLIEPELAGRLLEAAFTKGADYHKQRVLDAFGGGDKLPSVSGGDAIQILAASEKRYQKASDLLHRDQPLPIPNPEDGITKDLILSAADGLAWRGIDLSISHPHLIQVEKTIRQLEGRDSQVVTSLKKEVNGIKARVLESKLFYRDFFDSQLADSLGLSAPTTLRRFMRMTNFSDASPDEIEKGLSLEIATRKHLHSELSKTTESDISVGYGNAEEDAHGGDLVALIGDKVLHIDLKSSPPDGLAEDEAERGYRLYADKEKQIYKAVVWAESHQPVAEDSFRLTDPGLKSSLAKVIAEIR